MKWKNRLTASRGKLQWRVLPKSPHVFRPDSRVRLWRRLSGSWEAGAASVLWADEQRWWMSLEKAWRRTLNISHTARPYCMGNRWWCHMGERCGQRCRCQACVNATQTQFPRTLRTGAGLHPVGMLVTNSWTSFSSYRSGVTFSGQGRLKDILVWNKAQSTVNWNTINSKPEWHSGHWRACFCFGLSSNILHNVF